MLKNLNITFQPDCRIIFPAEYYQAVLEHCKRKLTENYIEGESPERKAFGLIGGRKNGADYIIERCLPLLKNARHLSPYSKLMDSVMAEYAVPSETPLAKRGWIAEPEELLGNIRQMQQENLLLLGAYHMHRVAWPDDPLRDTPTVLDTVLAADSKMIIFIISMVNADRPVLRAFYEGKPDKEVPVLIKDSAK
jgi:hypothetical protein